MTDELKKIEEEIKGNLDRIKDNNNIKKILEIIIALRNKMDKYDGIFINILDGAKRLKSRLFSSPSEKNKRLIVNNLYDIIEGFEKYSNEDKNYTLNELQRIAAIHDRSFWEKIMSILRAS